MQVVKAVYSTEEHRNKWVAVIKRLQTQIVRLAMACEDEYSLIRAGYPLLLRGLQEGKSQVRMHYDCFSFHALSTEVFREWTWSS